VYLKDSINSLTPEWDKPSKCLTGVPKTLLALISAVEESTEGSTLPETFLGHLFNLEFRFGLIPTDKLLYVRNIIINKTHLNLSPHN